MQKKYSLLVLAALFSLGVALWAALPGTSQAGNLYKYTDDNGNVHFVDDPRKIPTKYREGTESRRARTPSSEPAEGAPEGEAGGEEGAKEGDSYTGDLPNGPVDLTGLPADVDPNSVVGRDPKTGRFILDPTRPERIKKEKAEAEDLQKKQKLGQVDKEGHDEAFWRQKMSACRSRLRELEEAYRKNEYAYRNGEKFGIASEAAKIDQLKNQVERQRSECDRIPNEAKSAGAPPGWVR